VRRLNNKGNIDVDVVDGATGHDELDYSPLSMGRAVKLDLHSSAINHDYANTDPPPSSLSWHISVPFTPENARHLPHLVLNSNTQVQQCQSPLPHLKYKGHINC
jgi:hypothetical protein